MGKPSRRPGREDRDVHEAIRDEAAQVLTRPDGGASASTQWPALDGLMKACRAAVVLGIPQSFDYHGRRYYLRAHLVLTELEIFDGPGAAAPLMRGAFGGIDGAGHAPGH